IPNSLQLGANIIRRDAVVRQVAVRASRWRCIVTRRRLRAAQRCGSENVIRKEDERPQTYIEAQLTSKRELIVSIHDQLEAQVQFGDGKTTVLIAGDTLLLGSVGALAQFGLRCDGSDFRLSCLTLSLNFVLLFACAFTLIGA